MYIASLPGRFDDSLEWPAKGRINLVLCDQKQRRDGEKVKLELVFPKKVVPPNENGECMAIWSFKIAWIWFENYVVNGITYFRVYFLMESRTESWFYGKTTLFYIVLITSNAA